MSMQEAQERVVKCKREKSTNLILDRLDLATIPMSIAQLASLLILYIRYNQLRTLPSYIGQIANLQILDLSFNQISILPHSISRLTRLRIFDLSSNQLDTLPDSFAQLSNLQSLDLSSNQLGTLPESIAQLSNLQSLDLSSNQLDTLPESIAQLSNLQSLDLSSNQLDTLPESIIQLSSLRNLKLNDNPLKVPPLEVATRGVGAIRGYFAEKTRNSDVEVPLFESKLLLVGEGRVGKTSISKTLRIPNYQLEDEQSTEGIDIQRWTISKKETDLEQDFHLNVWDFGGQEIYHATHQFFLTRRSLYLLVTESRKEDKHDDFYYWFNVIRLLGDKAPVVVVLNKCDQPIKELPIEEYKKTFDNIADYKKISCVPGYKDTVRSLRATIFRIIQDDELMSHVGAPLPSVWVEIRHEIARLRKQGLNYISYVEFLMICANNEMKEDNRILTLSGYFHDLGIFLHFAEDWDLSDTVILNPEWVTDGVYKVLDNPNVKSQFGHFTDEDLRIIWSDEKYRDKRRELLSLMKNTKFEICYELPPVNGQRQGYLAPQLLPVDEIPYEWKSREENLRFEYRYKFMPKGILTRFIVKRHKDIAQFSNTEGDLQPVHWRYGVLLEWDNTRALVRERYFEKKITVDLEGQNKQGFLSIIRRSIEEIHDDFNNLEVDEMVPCDCNECRSAHRPHFYRNELLLRYLHKGRYEITCDVSLDDVDVRILLQQAILQELEWGDIENSTELELSQPDGRNRFRNPEGLRLDPYRRPPTARAGDFSRPVQGPSLLLSGAEQEVLHRALLDAFTPEAMRRLLNFKLNRRMDQIAIGKNTQDLFYEIIQAADREGWTGPLVEQAYRVNPGNSQLRAFVAAHLPEVLDIT